MNLKENILNDISNCKEYDNSKSLKEKYFIMDNFNNKNKINKDFILNGVDNRNEQEHSFQKISDDKIKFDLIDLSSYDNNSFLSENSENYFNELLNLI